MFLEAAVAQLAVLAVLKVFYPKISGHGEASKPLSSAMYLASRDQSFIPSLCLEPLNLGSSSSITGGTKATLA